MMISTIWSFGSFCILEVVVHGIGPYQARKMWEYTTRGLDEDYDWMRKRWDNQGHDIRTALTRRRD
jgi:hypothetical protein